MHRNRLRAICERIKPKRGERYRFATLTMLNPGLPLLKTRELINRAWTLFRKRSLCVSLIRGAAKSEEFTVTPNGYHYHIHLMVLSRWIPQAELARVWTDCVETAFNEANVHFDVSHTKHNRLNVDIREIRTAENGIKEVSKYITKSDSWLKLPGNVLAEIGLVERWHRMHELIGEFATINRAMKRPPKAKKPPFLDTQPVNDASRPFESASDSNCNETPTYWRRQAERMTSPEYLVQLHLDQQNAREARLRYLTTNFAEPIIESMQDAINNYYDRGS